MIEHGSAISGIAVAGELVATAGYDNRVILWNGRRAIARGWHDHLANHCAFDAGGRRLVTASSDHTARVWSLPDLRLEAVLRDHDDDVEMAAFDGPGERIATASRDHRLRVFARDGSLLRRLDGHEADVLSVAWAEPDVVVSSSDDGTVRRWNVATGALLSTRVLGVETDTIAIARDGVLFAGTDRGEIVTFGDAGREHRIEAHAAGIKRLALSPSGRVLASSSYDRTLRIWHVRDGHLVLHRVTALPAVIWARAMAIDDRGRVLMGTFGTTYAIFDPDSEAWELDGISDAPGLNAIGVDGDGDAIWAIGDAGRVLRDGREVARTGSSCNFIVAWRDRMVTGGTLGTLFDARTGAVLHQHRSPLNCATVLDDGDLLVGTYTGEGLRLGDDGASVRLREIVSLHDQAIKGVAADGGTIFSVSAAGEAAVWRDGRLARLPRAHDRIANGVVALGEGRFASVSRDRKLRLWVADRAEVIESPHTHSIKCVAATGDRQLVATGSYNGTLAVYDVGERRWSTVVRATTAGISALCASPRPGAVLASSYDGGLHELDRSGTLTTIIPTSR